MAPDIYRYTLPELNDLIQTPAVHDKLLSYFCEAPLEHHHVCPHCQSERRQAISGRALQPLIGYVHPDKTVNWRCEDCGLGYMSPAVQDTETHQLYDGFDQGDWNVPEPNEQMVTTRLKTALHLSEPFLPQQARTLDLGGGIGGFAYYTKKRHPDWQVVHSDLGNKVQPALEKQGIHFRQLNFLADPIGQAEYDLITAFEVIEHVSYRQFKRMLESVHEALRPGGIFTLSTPDIDSPLLQAFDFVNAYLPHHLLIFGRQWLQAFFADSRNGFRIVGQGWASDVLDDCDSYFSYAAENAGTPALRACAEILKLSLADPSARQKLLEQKAGTEIILVLQKV